MGNVKRVAKCYFCKEEFSKISCLKHLSKCEKRQRYYEIKGNKSNYYTIKVEGGKDYYLYLDVSKKDTLEQLDLFLRSIWLECCGHMSVFDIYGETYSSYPDPDFDDNDMSAKIGKLLAIGDSFSYEYDMGSTTTLRISVISEFCGNEKEKVGLAIRNIPPIYYCSCAKVATQICACCYQIGCKKCMSKDECGEYTLMNIVNSPRTGTCAYEQETSEEYIH